MTEFGRLIQLWRTRRGLSLSKAAALAGCTKAHLWELEQGRARNPTIRTIVGLARAYDGSIPYMAHLAAKSLFPAENSARGSEPSCDEGKETRDEPPLYISREEGNSSSQSLPGAENSNAEPSAS